MVELGAGVHVEPHSHANEQIAWMFKGKMEFRLGSEQHEAWSREDTEVIDFFRASAGRLPTWRQTRLHERGLNPFSNQGRDRGRDGRSVKKQI